MLIYYLILGIDKDSSDDEIRDSYLALVKQYPPEVEPESFKMITVAYEAIKDKRSRVKTQVFGTSKVAECQDIIRAATLSVSINKRSPLLKEIIDAETGNA
jgi:DnaJ-class molecular chaperone